MNNCIYENRMTIHTSVTLHTVLQKKEWLPPVRILTEEKEKSQNMKICSNNQILEDLF